MKVWRWPDPIILKHITDGPLQVRVWNPSLYPSDGYHKMPVITPAYPSMCSTHNVSESTMKVMIQEFERADEIANRVYYTGPWSDLFETSDFFYKYECYISIHASSCDHDIQLKWVGMVESRVRQLIKRLEAQAAVEIGMNYVIGVFMGSASLYQGV
jgi:poly(A) polymerase